MSTETLSIETETAEESAIFERRESAVQSYARSFPVTFETAEGAWLYDTHGNAYLDFLAGCGSLNYGHNDPDMAEALVAHIRANGITHGLDMHTKAKRAFLESLEARILKPRGMDHVVMFPGPTGTNAVEAALKIARKATGRETVINFTNGFHGVTLGALAASGNEHHRAGAGVTLSGVQTAPYDRYMSGEADSTELLDRMLGDPSSGFQQPAAVIVECVQGEGGITAARAEWLRNLEAVCRKHGVLLIVDDIQAGCGRTGTFFSFEEAGIDPDIITQAKSISGYGLPLALVLLRRELDVFEPGEHNGTFRGNTHAFVTARVALEKFWADGSFAKSVREKGKLLGERLSGIATRFGQDDLGLRGRGLMQGIVFPSGDEAEAVAKACFARGLIIETSGGHDEVVKVLCPLTITEAELTQGLDILEAAVAEVRGGTPATAAAE